MSIDHPDVTLFQFQLCPFCHKVRAALELKGVSYHQVEVTPGKKKELPELPPEAPKKVPVLQVGDEIIWDSTDILLQIDRLLPDSAPLVPSGDDTGDDEITEFEDWVDRELMPALPTVIYDTWGNAMRAARITARGSNFNWRDELLVRYGGSIIMRMIAKRILKREGRTDGHSWLTECLDTVEGKLDGRLFVAGDHITIADAALHGALKCVEEFPVFQEVRQRSTILEWYERIDELRAQ